MGESPLWIREMGSFISVPQHHLGGHSATIQLIEMSKIQSSQKILVLGCGIGKTAIKLAQDYECKIIGTDINPEAIQSAKKQAEKYKTKLKAQLTFLVDDLFHTQLTSGCFDRIIIESVIIMLPKNEALQQIRTLLAPTGIVVINEGLCVSAEISWLRQLELLFLKHEMQWHLPTYDEWKTNFEVNGFQIVQDSGSIPFNIQKMGIEMSLKDPWKMIKTGINIVGHKEIRHFFLKVWKLMRKSHLKWGYCLWVCALKHKT